MDCQIELRLLLHSTEHAKWKHGKRMHCLAPPGPSQTSGRNILFSDALLVCVSSHEKSLIAQPVSEGCSHISTKNEEASAKFILKLCCWKISKIYKLKDPL
ncbi:hypothetical protein FQA47_017069 [Oryzias melastigma]|uniref:Uncharacterized protein n=1 Tax=Oryzias melastigma TaxID=30732 RepID=A0A834L1D5_ORYME|nr:hypothetical protein FQA47_017069 [Oryzias melastigma]